MPIIFGDFSAQLLDVFALLADHDARTRRVDRDVAFLRRALDRMRLTDASFSFFLMNSRRSKSVLDVAGERLAESAYHFDVQSLTMPRRIPVGCTF